MPALYALGFAPRCGEAPPKRGLSHCIRDSNHDAGHVYYVHHRETLTYYDTFGKVLVHCDLKPGETLDDDDAAALWAYFEEIKEQRRRAS